jgi:hypothetical protein
MRPSASRGTISGLRRSISRSLHRPYSSDCAHSSRPQRERPNALPAGSRCRRRAPEHRIDCRNRQRGLAMRTRYPVALLFGFAALVLASATPSGFP